MSIVLNIRRRVAGLEAGQTLVEYSLIIALITLAAFGAVAAMAGSTGDLYDTMNRIITAMRDALA